MAKMMGRIIDSVPCNCCCDGHRHSGSRRAQEKEDWIAEALEDAREKCEAMPPEILEAALRSGTRATVR